MDVLEACRREVEELHAFFEAWFRADLPREEQAFGRFAGVLADGFELVSPDGAVHPAPALLGRLRAAHGVHRGTAFRIRVERLTARRLPEGLFLVGYEEWQESPADGARGRRSTALLRERPGAPCGLEWLHVHETWLAPAT